MKVILFTLVLLAMPSFGNSDDPQFCAYWLKNLDELSRLQKMRDEDVPKMLREDGPYAALDFDISLRERMRRLIVMMSGDKKRRNWWWQ